MQEKEDDDGSDIRRFGVMKAMRRDAHRVKSAHVRVLRVE